MKTLIKNEWKKLWNRKMIKISFFVLIILTGLYSALVIFQDRTITYSDEGFAYGLDSIRFEKSLYGNQIQDIDDKKINQIINQFQKKFQENNGEELSGFYALYSNELRPYEDVISLIDFTIGGTYTEQYERINEVNLPIDFYNLWKNKTQSNEYEQPFSFGYSKGYQRFLKRYNDFFLIVCLVIGVCLASIFSNDKESNMEDLLRTTVNYGTKLFVSRMVVGILFSTLLFLVSLLIYSIILFGIYGLEGSGVDIQFGLAPLYPVITTYGKLAIKLIMISFIAVIFWSLLIEGASKLFRSTAKTVIFAVLLCFLPMIFISVFFNPDLIALFFPITLVDISTVLYFHGGELAIVMCMIMGLIYYIAKGPYPLRRKS